MGVDQSKDKSEGMCMDRHEFNNKIWDYYLVLERDFFDVERYVSVSNDNFNTHSNEFAKQLMTICAEIDVVCKAACGHNGVSNAKNITDYANTLLTRWNDFTTSSVTLVNDPLFLIEPWKGWSAGNRPDWWEAYIDIKHHRIEGNNIVKANMGNVINALAALHILETYLYRDIVNSENPPKDNIHRPVNSNYHFKFQTWEKDIYMAYNLALG